MCGASAQQNEVYQQQANFLKTLQQSYATQFAGQQAILSQLNSTFQPILAAGPSQQGFSPGEIAALNTQAIEGVGQNYANLQRTLANNLAAQGGGNVFLPSGSNIQLQAELGRSAANQLSQEETGIQLANWAQGRQNFSQAAAALGGVSSQMNPIGYAGVTNTAGAAAGQTANQIAQANNAWMSALGGALGGGLGAGLVGSIPGIGGGGGGEIYSGQDWGIGGNG